MSHKTHPLYCLVLVPEDAVIPVSAFASVVEAALAGDARMVEALDAIRLVLERAVAEDRRS